MSQSTNRKTYSESVQRQAVFDVLVKHQSQKSVAQRLHCSPNTLCDWLKKYRHDVLAEEQQPVFAAVRTFSETNHQALEIIVSIPRSAYE
jgi:transposase-like protein